MKSDLIRGIRRWDLVALTLNGVVGAGIFGLPSRAYAESGAFSVVAIAACAVVASLRVLCYAEVGSRYPETGGPYLYAFKAFGPTTGFAIGWLDWLSSSTSFAALCALFPDYLSFFWPAAGAGVARALTVTIVVGVLTLINVVGIRPAARVANLFTVSKLLPLAAFVLVGIWFVDPHRFSQSPTTTFGAFSRATLVLLFAFGGFGSAVVTAGETRDPQRNIPFALLTAMGTVTALYVLIQIVCIGTLPNLATSTRPVADAGAEFFGGRAAAFIAAGTLISVLGGLHSLTLGTPRVIFAMAEHGQWPRLFTRVHERFRTPHLAILLCAAFGLAIALSGTFIYAVTLTAIARLLIMTTTCAAMPALRLRTGQPAPFQVPAGWLVAVLALALCGWLLTASPLREARDVAIALAVGMALFLTLRPRGSFIHRTRK
jgi:amino acid transporter